MQSKKTCVIVGYGAGLGAALARRFAREGYRIVGLARHPETHAPLPDLEVELRQADAADPSALAMALADLTPEVLIYNAYRMSAAKGGPSALDPADLIADFGVNVAGALAAVQVVLPAMKTRGEGSILFTGGGLAFDPTGWLAAASLAIGKAGLRSLAQSLNAELAGAGIHAGTVTIAGMIAPGTAFDPDRIAEAFWLLHADPSGAEKGEIVLTGDASPA